MQSINSSSSRREEGDTEEEAETEEEEAAAAVAAMARAANSGSSSKKVVQCIRSIITTTATLLLLLTFMTCPSCSGESVMDPAAPDAVILADFRNSVESDPVPKLAGWSVKSSSSVCSWPGVTCTDSRVSRLDLSNFNLQCNFSSVAILLTLQKLQSLVLSSNGVHGNLSAPANSRPSCSSSLTALDLSQNRLQGPLSSAVLGLCEKLSLLNVSGNQLNGPADSKSFAMASLRELDVSHNGISESSALGSVLSGCAKLQSLSISYNRISGFSAETLPAGGFLRHLDLSNNNISAKLSDFSLRSPSLALLDLSANRFTGGLDPSSLGDCGELRTLNLSMNRLSGPIPASFGTGLGKIEKLLLSANQLQGTIPSELGSSTCKTLQELDLSGNSFTGSIPSSFISCTSLHTINLSNNKIFGPLPIDLIASLPALKSLSLAYNNITGTLPASVSGFPNLEVLELSSNHLEGEIPVSFCRSESSSGAAPLKKLYLQNNRLSGTIPPGLADCSQLRSIDLSFNYLSGTIPPSLGSLQFLQDLVMWLNHLEGEIPAQISNIPTLENLILDNNLLNGTIPEGLRNCSNLVWISLSNNFLTGAIPAWIGGMDKLAILQLGNNSFSGIIPRELGFCKSLVWLDLNSNKLEGSIPPELSNQSGKIIAGGGLSGKVYAFLRNEAGSDCRGAGVLVEFGGIRREELMRIPMLHFCKFTRVYTGMTMYQFKDNGTMVFMDLSYNSLSGIIPDGIGSMYYLQVLNLAHNNLNGSIPQSLGGLKLLGLLDLSYNNLSGFIPPALSGLSLLTDLEVSNNNLSGEIPTGGQLSTFPANRYANNAGLCGVPLPPCSESSSSGIDDHPKTRRNQASLAGSVAMGLLFALVCIFAMIVVVIETRRKKKQEEVRDIFMDSLPTSGNGSWKFTGVLEPLSINVATFEKPLRKLTFAHLLEATNGFHADSLIGSGGFGDVYKAVLKDGTVVAIKKLIHISGQGDREFMAEMETIGKIKHRNLVPLLGYCKVGEERLLVYEYMRFGSLENVLHNQQKGGIKLDWAARKRIAIGAARGLAFLHHSCIPHIIHRDMKSSNVLIDENLEARVSDFGMARLMNAMDTHLSVSTLAGTPGYVPPEYYQSFRCTTKGDVYSYGVILLELLTGRRPTDSVDFGDNNLVGWVRLHSKMKIADVFDPELMKDPALETELGQYLKIGCECLDDRPWRRPTMIQVLAMFRELQKDGDETELDSFSLVDPTVEEAADAEV